jgi:hypothetical protein
MLREERGIVNAICINVDYNYLNDQVRNNPELIIFWIRCVK